MRLSYIFTATTGSLVTNLKVLRRYIDALIHHITFKKLINILKVEWAYWRKKNVVNAYPYILKIESTNICNLRCPFCLDRDRESFNKGRGFGRMKLDDFKKIIDALGDYTIRINLYGSGEPVLFPEIYDMVSYAASKNIGVAISANLSSFDPKNIDNLLNSGLEHLIISCHGASSESYLKYNVGGNFEKVIENMRLIVKRKKELKKKLPFIDWQFLLFSHNEHEKPLAKKLAKEIGVDIIRFIMPNIPHEHKEEWRPRFGAPKPPQTKKTEGEEETPVQAPPPPKGRIKIHRCSWIYRSIFFNWNGGVLPCCHDQVDDQHDFGSIEDMGEFMKMWNNDRYRLARDMANFKVHPETAPQYISCVNCPMPKLPFILIEKGYPLNSKLKKKIEPLMKDAPSLIPGPDK